MSQINHGNVIFILIALITLLAVMPANAQMVELWNATYDSGNVDIAQDVDTDPSGNVIVTGISNYGAVTGDYYTIKYDPDGNELWNATYDSGYQDGAWGVATDMGSNVTVTGFSNDSSTNNYYTIKYDPDGNELWNATYDGGEEDVAQGVATDSGGNVTVTGYSSYVGGTDNITTIKYDPNGNELWNVTYDSGYHDRGSSIATDNADNIIVTGEAGDGTTYNYFTIKYDPDGNELWNTTYDGGNEDRAFGVATDTVNNIVVTGYSVSGAANWDYHTIKYDPAGNELWNETYDSGDFDSANDVATDTGDNIIVTGQSRIDSFFNYYTIKYDSDGNEMCNVTYNSGFLDSSNGVATDLGDNVIVTGIQGTESIDSNYYTIKYGEEAEVEIDVKPGSEPNSINPNSNGKIPVAILTSNDFDATTVDPETVEFGAVHFGPNGGAMPWKYASEDVDDDGDLDLILHFKTQETGIEPEDTYVMLWGSTYDGTPFRGTDMIRIVPTDGF